MVTGADQPGSGDSSWYEWYVGLNNVIDLLRPDTNVESVTFQEARISPIDDVVVRYRDNTRPRCYQVKYKREGSEPSRHVTFADLVGREKGKDGTPKDSLLGRLAHGWKKFVRENGVEPQIVLYTNRSLGHNATNGLYEGKEYKQRPLGDFIAVIKERIHEQTSLEKICVEDTDFGFQLKKFMESIQFLTASEKTQFLLCLEIESSQPGLDETKRDLIDAIAEKICGGKDGLAEGVFDILCAELREWTTSPKRNRVTAEKARMCVAKLNHSPINPAIDVSVPNPVFPSRKLFVGKLSQTILSCEEPVVFIGGDAGAGKTRLVSSLCREMTPSPVRFYAFKPLDEEDYSYNPDKGVTDARSLWAHILESVRSRTEWASEPPQIPVINELCTDEELRMEAIRLAKKLSVDCSVPTVIIIDGIDHAARRGDAVTFLNTLPSPDRLPAGVKLVIAGQSPSLYPDYPSWLRTSNDLVRKIDIPALDVGDVVCLVEHSTTLRKHESRAVAAEICTRTIGNTLATVYAVDDLASHDVDDLERALSVLEMSGICGNLEEYYNDLWKGARCALEDDAQLGKSAIWIIAYTMHLLDGIVSPKILRGAFPKEFPEWYQAEMGLKALAPVVKAGEDGIYRPTHNDFRLFVDKIASTEQSRPRLKYAASNLAKYAVASDDRMVRSFFGVRLLSAADRKSECAMLFSTKFVMEAMEQGVPWRLLCEQGIDAYRIACESHDVKMVYGVVLAFFTMSQVHEHLNYYEEDAWVPHVTAILPSDLHPYSSVGERLSACLTMLMRIRWLWEDGPNKNAALELYDIWFGNYTPKSFLLEATSTDYQSTETPIDVERRLGDIMERWGEVAALLGVDFEMFRQEIQAPRDSDGKLLSRFCDGYIFERVSSRYNDPQDTVVIIDILRCCGLTLDGAKKVLRAGLSGSVGLCGASIVAFCEEVTYKQVEIHGSEHEMGLVFSICAAVATLSGRVSYEIANTIDWHLMLTTVFSDDEPCVLVAWCLVRAFIGDYSSYSEASLALLESLMALKKKNRYYGSSLRCAAKAAICLGSIIRGRKRVDKGTTEAEAIDGYLQSACASRPDFYYADVLLQYVIFASDEHALWVDTLNEFSLRTYALSGCQYMRKLRLLAFLMERGHAAVVGEFVRSQFNEDGTLIMHDTCDAETIRVLRRFISNVEPGLDDAIAKRARSFNVSFTDHKDDAIRHLIGLFRIAANEEVATEEDAQRLLSIDVNASKSASVDISCEAQEAVMAWALRMGVEQVSRVRIWCYPFDMSISFLWQQFEGLLRLSKKQEEVCACLLLAYVASCDDGDIDERRLSRAIRLCAERANVADCRADVESAIHKFIGLTDLRHDAKGWPHVDDKMNRKKGMDEELSHMSLDSVESIAFEAPLAPSYDIDSAALACYELVRRGEDRKAVYNRFVMSRKVEFALFSWEYSGAVSSAIKEVAAHTSDERFFELLLEKKNLAKYGYSTSASDVALAIRLRIEGRCPNKAVDLFRDECASKEAWLSANGVFPLAILPDLPHSYPIAKDIETLVADILIDLAVDEFEEDATKRCLDWGFAHSSIMRSRIEMRVGDYLCTEYGV